MSKKNNQRIDREQRDRIVQQRRRIFRLSDILDRYNLSKATVYRLMENGRFPRPVKIGVRAIGWRRDDLRRWEKGLEEA